MKFKKEYLILIVVIAALGLYLTTRSMNGNDQLPQPAKLEKTQINRLVLTEQQNAPVELVKKDERWVIEPQGYPADSAKVKNMVNSLSDLTLTALVSESGNYDRYGLTIAEKIFVQAYDDGAAVRSFSIGKAAPTFQHTFVLLDSDPKVYHARGQLERTFSQNIDSLRDKSVFEVDKQSITAVTLNKGDTTLSLTKHERPEPEPAASDTQESETPPQPAPAPIQWQDTDGRAVDQSSVDQLLGEIGHLDCDGFLADETKAQLSEALWTVSFKKGEETFSLSAYPKLDDTADKIPATASTIESPFVLNQPRIDTIEKSLNGLLGIEEEAENPNELSGIEEEEIGDLN